MFPFYDNDHDGSYEPQDYDYPLMRGDEALVYIFNDDCISWHQTGAESMGIEVRTMAYAFDCPQDSALHNTIFVHYDIINKSNITYYDTYVGLWSDLDVGSFSDDFIASDVMRGAYYGYNGDDIDGNIGATGHYGNHPPAQAVVFLGGPYQDADNADNNVGIGFNESLNGLGYGDGVADNERLGMSRFLFNLNGSSIYGDPQNAAEYYNYMRGFWRDSTQMRYGGNGHVNNCTSCEPANYMFPGDSDTLYYWGTGGMPVSPWNELTAANTPGDRRGLGSVGPFTLEPGEIAPVDLAFVFGRDYSVSSAWASVEVMKQRIDAIREMFINDSVPSPCGGSFSTLPLGLKEVQARKELRVYPNPTSNELNIELPEIGDWNISVIDMTGRVLTSYNGNQGLQKLDVSEFANGMYLIRLDNSEQVVSQIFIKK